MVDFHSYDRKAFVCSVGGITPIL